MDEIEIGEVVLAEVEDLKAAGGEERNRGHGAKQNVRHFLFSLSCGDCVQKTVQERGVFSSVIVHDNLVCIG